MGDPISVSIEGLVKRHDRSRFSCGEASLDDYLKKYAGQNERLDVSRHFVAVHAGSPIVLGYYSIAAGSVEWDAIPEHLGKELPKYPVPVAHLGRLAVDRSVQRQGLGETLLLDAVARIARLEPEIAIAAIEVVAIDDGARDFYSKYGFASLVDDKRLLYLPMATVRKLKLAH